MTGTPDWTYLDTRCWLW